MHQWNALCTCFGGSFKNTYELLNLRALKFSPVNKIHIFQCMGTIFCVEFQRVPLKFHTKYLPTLWKMQFLNNVEILRALRFKSSSAFLNAPQALVPLIHSCVPPLLLEWISEAGVRKHMLTYWGWDKIAAIFQMTYSKPFSSVKISVLIKISLKFVPQGPVDNIPVLVQIMAWRRSGDKPLSEPMMAKFNDSYMRHSASMK